MDRLNLFNYYKDKEQSHEDVLTRNFLVLLKNIPVLQIGFFEMIREKEPDCNLPSIAKGELNVLEVRTQTSNGDGIFEQDCDTNVLSILISDDELQTDHCVEPSERAARYDGVIFCDPSWLFIVENKPSRSNVWENQLDPNKDDVDGKNLIKKPCCLSWRDVIKFLNCMLINESVSGLEKTFIENFLEYVNEFYCWLNPYNKFSLCRGDKGLIDKRCAKIISGCFHNKETNSHKGWKEYVDTASEDGIVKQIALDFDPEADQIILWMYGGSTMNAARRLYEKINIQRVHELLDQGYDIRPNFHFSFQNSNLVWLSTDSEQTDKYIEYWKENRPEQIPKSRVEGFCEELISRKIVCENWEDITEKMLSKQYSKFNVCPEMLFSYRWSLSDACTLDDQNKFIEECKEKVNAIYSVYGNDPLA